jgi:hypothetical protein
MNLDDYFKCKLIGLNTPDVDLDLGALNEVCRAAGCDMAPLRRIRAALYALAPAQKPAEQAAPSEALARAMELADEYRDEPESEGYVSLFRLKLEQYLSQHLRAPGEDTERLDWLEKKAPGQINFDHTPKQRAGGHYIEIRVPFPERYRSNAPDLRTAIDAARTTKPEA